MRDVMEMLREAFDNVKNQEVKCEADRRRKEVLLQNIKRTMNNIVLTNQKI